MLNSFSEDLLEAGCDEAGRGCLAGPVFAAAVILPKDFMHPLLNDSKKMTEAARNILRPIIEEQALAWAVASCSAEEIGSINILNASILAMHRALEALKIQPELILVDGNRFKLFKDIQHQCIIGGDGKFAAIAAASVLAKTYRDEHMEMLHDQFPQYGWDRNKAYPTQAHRKAVEQFGKTPEHRPGFRM
jgi:ribonuclease HII